MTPLQIEILLHYNCCTTDYRDGDFSAPAVFAAIAGFLGENLLAGPRSVLGLPESERRVYLITDRGRAYVEALMAVPLPEWVPGRWGVPLLHPGTNSYATPTKKRPTIEELEAILAQPDRVVQIATNGEVYVDGRPTK